MTNLPAHYVIDTLSQHLRNIILYFEWERNYKYLVVEKPCIIYSKTDDWKILQLARAMRYDTAQPFCSTNLNPPHKYLLNWRAGREISHLLYNYSRVFPTVLYSLQLFNDAVSV